MATKAPRICRCGKVVASGTRCECMAASDRARKARFDKTRPTSSQRGYTGAWDRARAAYLAVHPYCVRCGEAAEHLDHKTPHKGDKVLFWDRTNWQGLCQYHHNSAKQREERKGKR
jgi:5-methylcytosine-specific restriction protein A